MRSLLLAAAAACIALPAQAQTELLTFSGTTDDGTYSRASGSSGPCIPNPADTYPFEASLFNTDTTGDYVITTRTDVAGGGGGYDGYLYFYEESFDPSDPCTNLIAFDDDFGNSASQVGGSSSYRGLTPFTLMAGQAYIIVQTAFSQFSSGGAYYGNIVGPEGATVTFGDGGGVEVPDVDLAVTPLVTAVPATGGKARFRTTVSNNSDARVEGSVVVSVNGVERRRLSSALTAGGSQSFTVNLSFPARVPEGIYQVSFMAMSDEGEMLDMEGAFDVLVGDGERLAHPSAVLAQLKARVEAGDKAAMGELDAYLAERQAAALLVSADASPSRAATVRQTGKRVGKPVLK